MKNDSDINPFIRSFYRGNCIWFSLAFVHILLLTASCLLVSYLIQQIIDMISGIDIGLTFAQVIFLSAFGILLYIIAYLFALLSKPKFICRAMEQYKNYVYGEISKKNISAFTAENSSLYISALSNDALAIETNYVRNIFVMIDSSVLFAGALALMFWYDPLLTVISIALSALPLIAAVTTGNLVAEAEKKVSERNESYMSTLKDSLIGFSVIKSFRAEMRMCKIFASKVREVSGAQYYRRKMAIIVQMMSVTAGNILQLGIFLIGAYFALSGSNISSGSVLVFVQLLNYIIQPIEAIPTAIAEQRSAKALIGKLAKALSENVRSDGGVHKKVLDNGICIEGLSFEYEEGKPVLKDVNLHFEHGKSYAIVGASGSGKSTLLDVLMAAHKDYFGNIRYDDIELRDIESASLYDMVSVIQQNVFIFNASIRDNITMFGEYSDTEVERAIALSGLDALIMARGEHYMCGENGSGLSGGEKQRISIARSLLKRSQVLLADEATAALDAETAFHISESLFGLDGITRIIITHSLDAALLRRYDSIITLKQGTVAEIGSFDDLIAAKGYFYSLYNVLQ